MEKLIEQLKDVIAKAQIAESDFKARRNELESSQKAISEREQAAKVREEALALRDKNLTEREKTILQQDAFLEKVAAFENQLSTQRLAADRKDKELSVREKAVKDDENKIALQKEKLANGVADLEKAKESYKIEIEKAFLAKLKA